MSLASLIAFGALALAAIPCGLFLSNLFVYQPTRRRSTETAAISVLIPARNEETSIRAAVESVFTNRNLELEVLVLDDHSTDHTASIISELAAGDGRVRLLRGSTLPAGWCGKQFACQTLADQARHPLLVFMDADVRLEPDALTRMAAFLDERGADLASGVPRQITGTFLERLLIPLIQFVLLGFLPMHAMRASRKPKFAAGCGQLFVARREAYLAAGGHAAIRASLHDGVQLPRAFRRAGFSTDLFDATDLATCRMYRTNDEVWRGLGKNATEGLAAPRVLPVMTLLLLVGQVLPFLLLASIPWLPERALQPAIAAALCAWLPRMIGAWRFKQSSLGALLHPLGILLLLAIQWQAWHRQRTGAPMNWKGRAYPAGAAASIRERAGKIAHPVTTLLLALGLFAATGVVAAESKLANEPAVRSPKQCLSFTLEDQYEQPHAFTFPRTNLAVVIIADQKGAQQINGWTSALKQRYGQKIDYAGVADVRTVPGILRGLVRSKFKEKFTYPVMLDWSGKVCTAFGGRPGQANLFFVGRNGTLRGHVSGPVSTNNLGAALAVIDQSLAEGIQPVKSPTTQALSKKLTQ